MDLRHLTFPHNPIYLSLGLTCFTMKTLMGCRCEDLKASATNAAAVLSYPGTFRFPLVLQEPLTNYEERMAVNVSCAAMGQTGPCAPEAVTSGLSGFPCRQVRRERVADPKVSPAMLLEVTIPQSNSYL